MQGPASNMSRSSRSRSSSTDPPRAQVEAIDPKVIHVSTHSSAAANASTAANTGTDNCSGETPENEAAPEGGVNSSVAHDGCAAFCRCCCYVPCVGMRHCCEWFVCKKKKNSQKKQPSTPKLGGSAQVGIVDETVVPQQLTEEQKTEQRNREESDAIESKLEKRWNNKMSAAVNLMREVGLKFSLDTRVMRMLTDMAVPKAVARHSTGIAMHNVTIRDADLGPGMPGGEWYIPAGTQHSTLARFNADKMFHKDQNVILYLHGGAMCLCSHKTHREMLLRLVGATGMILLAIEYVHVPTGRRRQVCPEAHTYIHTLMKRAAASTVSWIFYFVLLTARTCDGTPCFDCVCAPVSRVIEYMEICRRRYRRPPESPWPIPVDDCFNVYKMLSELEVVSDPRLEPLEEGVVAAEAPGSHAQRAEGEEGGGAAAGPSEEEFSTAEGNARTSTPLSGKGRTTVSGNSFGCLLARLLGVERRGSQRLSRS